MSRRVLQICIVAAALATVVPQALSQSRISIDTIAYNYVGPICIDPASGTGQVAGYFASIAGIDSAFQATPSETTALFTYRSEREARSIFTSVVLADGTPLSTVSNGDARKLIP